MTELNVNLRETTLSSELKFSGKIITVRRDDVQLPSKQMGFREVVEHPGGVVIVPIIDDNKVILIKQWRYSINQELIELPAGKLEPGEDPYKSALRELREETGYTTDALDELGYAFSTPGFCTEKLYFYRAKNLRFVGTDLDDGEVIEPFIVDAKELFDLIKNGKIHDAKTIAAVMLCFADSLCKL